MNWPAKTLCYDERHRKRFDRTAIITKDTEFEYRKFRQGIILFNSGEFFKAHEVWEELWLVATETDKLFLQGMIQIAAAFHHYTRGNVNGTRSLLEAGSEKLGKFATEYRGTDLNALRGATERWIEALTRGEHATLGDFPRIEFADRNH
ncbi:MAG: DUF309 domain-containing protein [Candidatus Acidiferrales bacterium]